LEELGIINKRFSEDLDMLYKFEWELDGVPCEIRVTNFFRQKPLGRLSDDWVDGQGYVDIEYEVWINGERAEDLESLIDDAENARIEAEILQEEKRRDKASRDEHYSSRY